MHCKECTLQTPSSMQRNLLLLPSNLHSTSSSLMVAAALNRMPGACGEEPAPPHLPCCPRCWSEVGVPSTPAAAAAAALPAGCNPLSVGVRAGSAWLAPPRLAASSEASTSAGASCTRASRTSRAAARLACGAKQQGASGCQVFDALNSLRAAEGLQPSGQGSPCSHPSASPQPHLQLQEVAAVGQPLRALQPRQQPGRILHLAQVRAAG